MNSFYHFLLVSRRDKDAYRIREEIERNRLYQVYISETAQDALSRISTTHVSCLVFNLDTFNVGKIRLISTVRDLGYRFPLLVFATHIQQDAIEAIRKMDYVVTVEKPFEAKDIWGICQKFVQGKKVNQRVFRRFYTNQGATVEKYSGEVVNGQIFNLSRGGAYMELSRGTIAVGDMVRMTIQLDKIPRAYNVNAQVVWATEKGYWAGKPAAGLQFIKAGDVYRNLLNKL